MNKIFRLLTALLFATALLVACGGGASSESSTAPSLPRSPGQGTASSTTTVLVYMMGTNLESQDNQASANIKEMFSVGSTSNMNVIIQTGGANKLPGTAADIASDPTRAIDWTKVQRYLVQKGTLSKLDDLGPDASGTGADMGSPATLQSFLAWGVKAYPADKYIVVLWDHGGGINGGIGSDEITKNALSVPVIQASLQAVSQANQNVKFDMVGFDACLMANAEVAASLANSTKYMVASQDLEPGGGWAWDGFLTFVTGHPAATGREIGAEIADSYLVKMNKINQTVTLSVTDLSKVATLSAATDGFASALQKYTVNTPANLIAWKQIAFARAKSLDWQTAPILAMSTDLVDMVSFPANIVTNINKYVGPDQPLTDASDTLYNAVSAAVVYKRQNGSNLYASGLSLYFPSTLATYNDKSHTYASNTMLDGKANFSSSYTDGSTGLVKTYYDFYAANKDKLVAQVTMDPAKGKYVADISNDFAIVLAAHQADACQIYINDKFYTEPCFDAIQDNVSTTTGSTGQWGVDFIGAQSWVSIEGSAYTVAMIPDQVATASSNINNRSLVPVYRYWPPTKDSLEQWESGALSVEEYVPDGGSTTAFKVLGFQAAPGSSSNPGKIQPIKDKDQFALGAYYLATFTDNSKGYIFARTDREVTVSGGTLNLTRGSIPSSGNFGYIVTDLTGALSVSNTVGY